jgi:hypothetical protein
MASIFASILSSQAFVSSSLLSWSVSNFFQNSCKNSIISSMSTLVCGVDVACISP